MFSAVHQGNYIRLFESPKTFHPVSPEIASLLYRYTYITENFESLKGFRSGAGGWGAVGGGVWGSEGGGGVGDE